MDTIGNFLTIIRNAVATSKFFTFARYSRMNHAIGKILKAEGFIKDIEIVEEEAGKKQLKIALKYVGGESVIHSIDRVSKPSRRVYRKVKNFSPVIGGLGVSILTTNKGLMTDKRAKSKDAYVGGEVICTVW